MGSGKILTDLYLSEIKENRKKKIVLCHGVFDLVHYGHIMHFKSAKKHGDILVVSITKDKFIKDKEFSTIIERSSNNTKFSEFGWG